MNRFRVLTGAVLGLIAGGAALAGGGQVLQYPKTVRIDQVDDYQGQKIADPFQWLEKDVRTNSDVREWVEAQNQTTFGYLDGLPERKEIASALTKLWNYEKYSAPSRRGTRYVFSKNDGLQNQSVMYVMNTLDGEPRVLIDPNTLSKDGTVALSGVAFTDDGRYMAYGLASAGSDWNEWRVRDVETAQDLPDLVKWVKFSGASWLKDNSGFFYSRFDEPKEGQAYQSLNLFQKVYFHKLGTPQSEDQLVYENKNEAEWGFGAAVTEDGLYLVVSTYKGTDPVNHVAVKELGSPDAPWQHLVDRFEANFDYIWNDGPVFYFQTDLDAPKNRIIAIDLRKPDRSEWKTVVAETSDTLVGANVVNRKFVCSYLKDAATQVRLCLLDGQFDREVKLPSIGTASGFGGRSDHIETFYAFSSFAVPPSIYRYDMVTGTSKLLRQAKVDMNPDEFVTDQVFYASKDGTKVPMFITHRKGMPLNGENPTLLYAYGGFNQNITPSFSPVNLMWLKMGGVYAVPNLRGGGEYGKQWHEAGKLLRKQNVFDDFIAAAEYLIDKKYTSSKKLAIRGGSNGGLLVGAAMTQRPELFGVAIPQVGVMDMLRFHKFTAGRYWVDEYGSSDDSKMFSYLLGYSPYHALMAKGKRDYPATIVTTADTDDRVVPGHSFKFAAALQENQSGPAPVVIRIETKAGHGAGKPTSKMIEEAADILAFTAKNLGMDQPIKP